MARKAIKKTNPNLTLTVDNIRKVRSRIRKLFLGKKISYLISQYTSHPYIDIVTEVTRVTIKDGVGKFYISLGKREEEKIEIRTSEIESRLPCEYTLLSRNKDGVISTKTGKKVAKIESRTFKGYRPPIEYRLLFRNDEVILIEANHMSRDTYHYFKIEQN